MTVIGIDGSTSCSGYAIFTDGQLVDCGKIKPSAKLEWRSRIMWEAVEFIKLIRQYRPTIAYIEDVPLKDGKQTIIKLGAVHGMILALCGAFSIEVHCLLPAVWRRELGLFDGTRDGMKRDAMKKKALEMANGTFNLNLTNDDTAEAILIAWSQIHT